MTNVTKATISTVSIGELVAFYNSKSPKPVKKFADRKTAERRVMEFLEDSGPKGAKAPTPKAAKAPAAKTPKVAKEPKAPKEPVSRAAAIAKSWTNPATKAARSERSHVIVDKVQYRSVLQAFEELSLDVKKHIAFRGQLKASEGGKLAFAGKVFKLVAAKVEE